MLTNLGVGGQIARPDAVAQHRRGLSLGHVQIIGAGQIEPAGRRFLAGGNQCAVKAPRGLDGDLAPQPVGCRRNAIPVAVPVLHNPFTSKVFYRSRERLLTLEGGTASLRSRFATDDFRDRQ